VIPTLKVLPGARVLARVAPLQLSLIVGAVQVTTAWQEAFAFTVIFEGQPEMTGFVTSATITLKVHVDVFPAPSVAV
jgi:hypothetical protein